MEISVKGRHVEISSNMNQFARDKVSRLQRLYDRIEHIDVVIDHDSGGTYRTEIILRADHKHTFVAHAEGADYHESVDVVIDKMERQLREHKEKFRNRKHPGGSPEE